jgi:hypothetical protein
VDAKAKSDKARLNQSKNLADKSGRK